MKKALLGLSLALISAWGCDDPPTRRPWQQASGQILQVSQGASMVNGGHTYTIIISDDNGSIWSMDVCCSPPPVWAGLSGYYAWLPPDGTTNFAHNFWVVRRRN